MKAAPIEQLFLYPITMKTLSISAILLSVFLFVNCTTEKYFPVFGQECFHLEEGQKKMLLSDSLLADYEHFVSNETGFSGEPLPVNRIFKSDELTSVVLVSLDSDVNKVNPYWKKQKEATILQEREDSLGFHYIYQGEENYYLFIQKNTTPPTVLFWELSSDSNLLVSHYNNTEYYTNKFHCKD